MSARDLNCPVYPCSELGTQTTGVRTKALPDICPPMKNDMREHLPTNELQGWIFAPSLFLQKFPFKNIYFGQSSLYKKTLVFLKVTAWDLIMSSARYECNDLECIGDFRIYWRKPWALALEISTLWHLSGVIWPPHNILGANVLTCKF